MLGSCVRPSTTGAYAAAAGWRRTIAGFTSTSATSETVVPLGSLRYPPPHSEEAVTGAGPTGYKPPLGNTDALPFRVLRTKSGRLPIYTDYKNGRTKKITILRKFSGDRKELREEVWRVLGGPKNPGLEVVERAGSLEIKGDYTWQLQMWLKRLGF